MWDTSLPQVTAANSWVDQGQPAVHDNEPLAESGPSESPSSAVSDGSARGAELQKLKAERDSLLDRLARAQAEFENARRRASKEQQDFRDYASFDTIKSLLPVLDSLERALKVK